ncbi:hypothetical protein F511_14705 [Dorcoceras hygrometricum]|uniref:Uncharacterized protein n=1 Tax=Dorcoceras hygrometricum TaxID=472368 RepID=A0A2Z7BK73_9LAMI|nr:hypothetical protein F511_14705 [Dorcoceras hygrometricum]
MAQLERTERSVDSPKTPRAQTSPTFEQLLRAEDAQWSSHTSPLYGTNHDQEEHTSPTHNKKSVLTKVKERAKKLRHSLSGRKRQGDDEHDGRNSPSAWGNTLDDEDDDANKQDDDPEFLGAPMYESELAPASYIENARQHPRAVPVLSEKHMLPTTGKQEAADQEIGKPFGPSKTISETVSDKFSPAYAAVSDATHTIASKIAGLTVTSPESQETSRSASTIHGGAHNTPMDATCISVGPHANFYDATNLSETSGNLSKSGGSPQKWDKGVSMKEYFLNKLEPGEDEKALSKAITEAISPRKSSNRDAGVVDKVKGAVTSFFWNEEQSNSMTEAGSSTSVRPVSSDIRPYAQQNRISTNIHPSKISKSSSANYSRHIPISTNTHEEYAEENLGRILQTN